MSKLLKAFYLAYAAWLAGDTDDETVFCKANGLCSNLQWYCAHTNADKAKWFDARNELHQQFITAGLDETYPFGGCGSYAYDSIEQTHHLNPKRIAWVREQVEKIKAES